MKALVINCTLKKSPEPSATEALASVVAARLSEPDVRTESVRAVDLPSAPGVVTDAGDGDAWPRVHERLPDSEILVVASPTWPGRPSSVAQRGLERMDAMMSETDDEDRPAACNRVAGVALTGNEDGAHHVISEISGALADIGCTIPGRAWPYWHLGPGPGPDCLEEQKGRDRAHSTGRAMTDNLHGVARALADRPLKASS
ncbi:NAD(P)H-dependent oxidoreductase [Streptomyces sp. NBC_00631]|uniref:flavodoxin family protein n=1 Tax=Streptomyces sp. NBC_00631 TaxID=2975793 RepID=UPI0030E2BE0C